MWRDDLNSAGLRGWCRKWTQKETSTTVWMSAGGKWYLFPHFPCLPNSITLLFTSLTFSEANIVILQGTMACSLVDIYPNFLGMSYCRLQGRKKFILLPWSWRQDVPPTCWCVYKIRHTTQDTNLNSFCRLSVSLVLLSMFYTQESLSVVSSENRTLTRIFGFHAAEVTNNWKNSITRIFINHIHHMIC